MALVGGGFIGPVHAEALRRIGADIVGLLGSSAETRADHPPPIVSGSLAFTTISPTCSPIVNCPTFFHVASPNAAHFEQARRILESGRHVVCQKPLATTAAETRTPLTAFCADVPNKWLPLILIIFAFIPLRGNENTRRAPRRCGSCFEHQRILYARLVAVPRRLQLARLNPTAAANLRCCRYRHTLDGLAQYVVGDRIRSVFADLAIFHPKRERPERSSETFNESSTRRAGTPVTTSRPKTTARILFRTDAAARCVFHVSQAFAGHKNRLLLEIAGTDGALAWNSEQPEHLWIGRRGEATELLALTPPCSPRRPPRRGRYPGGHAEGFPEDVHATGGGSLSMG